MRSSESLRKEEDSLRMAMDNGPEQFRQELEDRIRARVERKMRNRDRNRGRYHGLVPGAAILAIGVIFLLDHFGIVQAWHFFRFWPLILIAAGLLNLADPCRRFWGIGLTVFGTLLFLSYMGIARFSWGELWPMVLIAAGAMAMWKAVEA